MDIKAVIRDFIAHKTPEVAAVEFGIDISQAKQWAKLPNFEAVNWYLEKVIGNAPAKPQVDVDIPEPIKSTGPKPHELDGMQWEGKRLSVLFPCYKDTNPATAWCLLAIALDLGREKVRFDMEIGDAMIYHSRNALAHRFVESGCEWSFWLDDDMIIPIGRAGWFKKIGQLPESYSNAIAGQHTINRLIQHNRKMVAGTYFGRNVKGRPMFHEGLRNSNAEKIARSNTANLIETKWAGTGCLLVHRDVYLDIQKKFPELAPTAQRPVWNYFQPLPNEGEDAAFGMRAAECGHKTVVDTSVQCLHLGRVPFGGHNTGSNA